MRARAFYTRTHTHRKSGKREHNNELLFGNFWRRNKSLNTFASREEQQLSLRGREVRIITSSKKGVYLLHSKFFKMKMPTHDQNPGKKAYSGFGNLMLEKMGWKHGDALGANPSKGLKEAISVDMKNDREGVGKEKKERYNWEEKWWEGHFKSAAEKFALAVVEGGGKGGGKDDDDERKGKGNTSNSSSSSSESEDEFERNVREITSGNNVLTKEEELKEEKGDDGVKYNGCQKELEVAREIAREQSSFRGRKGKLKRIAGFEEAQMNALLKKRGFSREETIMNTNLEIREIRKAEEKDDDDEERKEREENTKKKRRKNFEEKKKGGEAYEGKPSETTEKFSWWRNAGFSWGGLVGSKRELDRDVDINEDNHKENNKNGFTEDKQEDIFNQAHQMASAKGSRRGLGDKAKLGKEFTGTKRSFDEDEEKEDFEKKKRKEEKKMKKKKEKKKEKNKSKTRDEDKVGEKKKSSSKKKSKKTK